MVENVSFIRRYAPYVSGLTIIILIGLTAVSVYYNKKQTTGSLIAQHVKELGDIFLKIHKECTILGFDHQKNYIDFLNTISFQSSEVGSMNLAYPDKWQGPYLNDNPTIQTKSYLVIKTKQGLFITPGEGVTLPNGKIVGNDIKLDEDADILAMMRDPNTLLFDNKPLAFFLDLRQQNAALPSWDE